MAGWNFKAYCLIRGAHQDEANQWAVDNLPGGEGERQTFTIPVEVITNPLQKGWLAILPCKLAHRDALIELFKRVSMNGGRVYVVNASGELVRTNSETAVLGSVFGEAEALADAGVRRYMEGPR